MGNCGSNTQGTLNILHVPVNEIISNTQPVHSYPHHNFIIRENIEVEEDGQKKRYIRFDADETEYAELSFPVMGYLSRELLEELGEIEILQVFLDEVDMDKCLYLISHQGKRASLGIRKFNSFESDRTFKVANEIYTAQKVALLKSPYLHGITHSFAIEPTNELISHYSQLIFMEPVDTSLSAMIEDRRCRGQVWQEDQFLQMMEQMVEAVSVLHKNWLAHNDIRPSNILYSHAEGRYLLTSFSYSKVVSDISPAVALKRQNTKSKKVRLEGEEQKDYFKTDVYNLGLTFLNALFLCQPIDRKNSAPFLRELANKHPYLHILKDMLAEQEDRPSIGQVRTALLKFKTDRMSAHGKEKGQWRKIMEQQKGDAFKKEMVVAEGYKSMGALRSWKKKLSEHNIFRKLADQSVESAHYFEELAIISSLEGNHDKQKSYYLRAAEIFHQVGTANFRERDYGKSMLYFRHQEDCLKRVNQEGGSRGWLRMRVSLLEVEVISGSEVVELEALDEVQRAIQEMWKVDVRVSCQCLQQLANIYDYYQNFVKVEHILTLLQQHIQQITSPELQLQVARAIIRNHLKLIPILPQEEGKKLLEDTVTSLATLNNDKEYYLMEHPLQKLQLQHLESLLQSFLQGPSEGRNALTALLLDLKHWKNYFQKQQDRESLSQLWLIQGETLEELGDIEAHGGEDDEACFYYSQAFNAFRFHFGNFYNLECGLVAQKLGRVRKAKGNRIQYQDCRELLVNILEAKYYRRHKHALQLAQNIHESPKKNKISRSFSFATHRGGPTNRTSSQPAS